MTTAIAHLQNNSKKDRKPKQSITLENFLSRYSNKEDGYKYEWHNGKVEQTPRTMNRDQSKIQAAILAYFYTNPSFRHQGAFLVELDMFIPTENRTRRADMAFLTKKQMDDTENGDTSVAPFVIEVISNFDKINEFEAKLKEYFVNGVQVVWQIIPLFGTVKVFTSVKDVKICQDSDKCSAAPVLPNFEMTVQDIFAS